MTFKHCQERNGRLEYRRGIPVKLRYLFGGKTEYVRSLKTRDLGDAAIKYAKIHREFEVTLAAAKADPESFRAKDFEQIARDIGIQPVSEDFESMDVLDLVEITARNFEAISKLPHTQVRAGVYATALISRVTLKDYYEKYLFIVRDKDLKRSRREKGRYHDPIKLAIKECIAVVGNVDVRKMKKADAYRFRDKLISDVENGVITASTANKKLLHLRKVVTAVNRVHYPDLANPFEIDAIEDNAVGNRPPFSEMEIEKIETELAESGLNDELKAIIVVGMLTGAGCKEIALLTSNDIILNADIPHIKIGANEFRVKVKHGGDRHRAVPLYGEALTWMKKFPDGFERYRRDGGGEAVSAASAKFLKRVTGKTFYSFRHRLADLLRNSGCEDQLRNAIFGHKQYEMTNHYGDGWGLRMKLDALQNAHELGRKQLKEEQRQHA